MSPIMLLLSLITLTGLINSSSLPKTAATSPTTHQNYEKYVKKACNSTQYPTLCYNSLSPYSSTIKSDPIKLCTTSIGFNVKVANNATSIVSNLFKKAKSASSPDVQNLKLCLEMMKDAVDSLKESFPEMKSLRVGGKSAQFTLDNVITWMSAAVTYEATCMDDLEEGTLNVDTKKKLNKTVTELSRITSNTLALVAKYPRY